MLLALPRLLDQPPPIVHTLQRVATAPARLRRQRRRRVALMLSSRSRSICRRGGRVRLVALSGGGESRHAGARRGRRACSARSVGRPRSAIVRRDYVSAGAGARSPAVDRGAPRARSSVRRPRVLAGSPGGPHECPSTRRSPGAHGSGAAPASPSFLVLPAFVVLTVVPVLLASSRSTAPVPGPRPRTRSSLCLILPPVVDQ